MPDNKQNLGDQGGQSGQKQNDPQRNIDQQQNKPGQGGQSGQSGQQNKQGGQQDQMGETGQQGNLGKQNKELLTNRRGRSAPLFFFVLIVKPRALKEFKLHATLPCKNPSTL